MTSVQTTGKPTDLPGRTLETGLRIRRVKAKPLTTPRDQPRASSPINDNYFVNSLQDGLLAGSKTLTQEKTINVVNCHVVTDVPSAPGHSQKRELSPGTADCQLNRNHKLKYVKVVSCVTQLSCVQPVNNAPNVVQKLLLGARLQNLWQTWLDLGAGPKVIQTLREGYSLPFRTRPKLTKYPTVVSCYVHPHRNSYLLEALRQLIDKNAVELVQNQTSLGFFNRLFLVPKPNNKWRPILDLSKLNPFLKVEKFKMETPETIRTSLQQGEWVMSIDFKDTYFHIPIQAQSRKYIRFHVQGQTYQFKALPFGLSTAPMEFTVVAKEVKLMAIHKGIRIHPNAGENVPRPWLASEFGKIRTGAKTGFQLCRSPVRTQIRSGPTHTGPVAKPTGKVTVTACTTGLSGPAVYVPERIANGHRETSSPRSVTYEAHPVAPQKQLASSRITGKGHSYTQDPAPSSTMVVR